MSEIYFDFAKKGCAIDNFYSQLCYGYQITQESATSLENLIYRKQS